ncbi:MAG: malto-oligosyltrehalose synthase, partial [Acetobacteraceae bacterium]|nr:malto-oligosyltrehalose synthase [Acetobacteraceae bacterium]
PLLKARPGSTHGYDIVDHHAINPELGGEPALRRLIAALRARDMGLILDIVPNHMGVGGADNTWWLDVLEWGRASSFAEYFDIDWEPADPTLRGRVLAPFLGTSYGEALEGGDLVLRFDPESGRLYVSAYDTHCFPIDPRQYATVLREGQGAFDDIAARFSAIGPGAGGREGMRARAEDARQALRQAAIDDPDAMEAVLRAFAHDSPEGRESLHRLLERQNYRLAWWRAAGDEINWRRFFDINSLAGIRVELPQVFDDTHECILSLYAEGLIDGVRIDHVDGLADPRAYCRKLRRRLDAAARSRPKTLPTGPAVIWVEKILAPHEYLPTDWLTDGTTGYDFMNEVSALLHDPAGEAPLTQLWAGLTGRPAAFEEEARPARRQIVRESLFSELYSTATALHRIARRDLHTRDYTLTAIRRALEELLVHFPVYRIYSGLAGISERDARVLAWAMAGARRTLRRADQPLLELVGRWLSGEDWRDVPPGPRRQERLRAMVRFQQLSSPTAAKSIEDTAFYRYGRLLSRNEVGAEPSQFAFTPAAFHAVNRERRRRYPRALLATATHDHKRGEDTRVRIAVLSEIPDEWESALNRWMRLNAPLKREVEGHQAPDTADEIMLYETLVGAWPLDLFAEDRKGLDAFRTRIWAWQEKALREAKRLTSWAAPNDDYEAACREFLNQILDPDRPSHLAQEIAALAARIAPAGALNGLTQTLLRCTSPGVPDLYQGTEFWDLSLVDPDNRRPVDFAARARTLADDEAPVDAIGHWQDGRVKEAVIARALAFRRRAPGLFAQGTYVPLKLEGKMADHALAFARVHEGRAAVTVVTRLAARLEGVQEVPLVGDAAWQGTAIILPRNLNGRRIDDVLGGPGGADGSGRLLLAGLLARLPVALLEVQ